MGTREEVSLRGLKDLKDSEVESGAEPWELGCRRGAVNGEPDRHALTERAGRVPPTENPGRGLRRWMPAEPLLGEAWIWRHR